MCMPLRQGAGAGAGISPEFVPGGTPLRPSPRPAPLSNRVDSPHPPLRRGIPIRPSPAAPPRPRCALLPRPSREAGAVLAISREGRIRFFPEISPCSGPWWLSPRGEGTGAGAVLAISGGKPCPGVQTHRQCETDRYPPPLVVPVIENRCTSLTRRPDRCWQSLSRPLVPNARANGAASPEVREESVKQRMPGPTVGRLHPCAERGDGRRKRHLPGPVFRAGRGDPALFRTDTGKIA